MFCSSCGTEVIADASFCQECGTKVGAASKTAAVPNFSNSTTPAVAASSGAGENDKLFAILTHLGGIFFSFVPSLIIFLIKKDSPGWVLDNARAALNWQITVFISSIVCFILAFILIGLFMFWALMLANLVFCIMGTVKASEKQVYRYPFSLRLLK